MSIEKMDSILLVVPSGSREKFINWLYEVRQVHVKEFINTPEQWSDHFSKIVKERNPVFIETQISKLQSSVEILREFHKQSSDFLESLFPVKTITTLKEVNEAAREVDPDTLLARCLELQQSLSSTQEQQSLIAMERSRLEEFSFTTQPLKALKSLKNYTLHFVAASGATRQILPADDRLKENIWFEPLIEKEFSTIYMIAAPIDDLPFVRGIIADYSMRELVIPEIKGTIAESIAALDLKTKELNVREETIRQEGLEFYKAQLAKAELAAGAWESIHNSIRQEQYMVSSNNLFAARGYIRTSYRENFIERMEREFPDAELVSYEMEEESEPPVSLTWHPFFRPAGLLVNMFGLPSYRSIDPTKFLTLSFLIFFGICFGDVLYGAMLLFVSLWLRKRFADQKGLVEFFKLFTYASISAITFGFLMGSWGADLPAYFGEDNFVNVLRMKLTLLDPLAKPIVALGVAVTIGVANQLYGVMVRMYRDIHRGDLPSAIYDGLFWLVYLVSVLTAAIGAALGMPHTIIMICLVLIGLSALGLVLTQGREEHTLMGKAITGVVSIYGIMGTYGTTQFMGDVISYSRLMALGLTTTVVGMSFNIIANMVRGIPSVGIILFIAVIVFGHVFNFTMSILTAFVHSARLILLEWFGRFYESGGVAFRPYGFSSTKIEIVN